MRIKISQIDETSFDVRDETDREYIKELAESLKRDGQWDPVIIRPNGRGGYELLAGHYRVLAAKKLGWKEIEALMKDVGDVEADVLSLKTNLLRSTMSEIEEGKVVRRIMENHDLTQKEIAEKLGRSPSWIQHRLTLVLGVVKEVQDALSERRISSEHAFTISQLNEDKFKDWKKRQREFLNLILKHKWTRDETRRQLKRYLNDTIYTIGHEGRSLEDLLKVLGESNIHIVVDIRYSAESQHKPEFSKSILERELRKAGIQYEHHPEFGIPFDIQNPYKDGGLSFACLDQWYRWHIKNETEFEPFAQHLKDAGRPAFMCVERYAEKKKRQKVDCHRHILANIIGETLMFPKRVDL